jgi:hypothetical protein
MPPKAENFTSSISIHPQSTHAEDLRAGYHVEPLGARLAGGDDVSANFGLHHRFDEAAQHD